MYMNFIVGRIIISAMRTPWNPYALLYSDAARTARRENVAQGSLSRLAALPPRRALGGATGMFSETVFGMGPSLKQIFLFAARQKPAPLEKPQGRRAGPALHPKGGCRGSLSRGVVSPRGTL